MASGFSDDSWGERSLGKVGGTGVPVAPLGLLPPYVPTPRARSAGEMRFGDRGIFLCVYSPSIKNCLL